MKTSKQNQACRSIVEERITDKEGNVNIVKYGIGKYLGKGGFAKVYVISNIDNDQKSAVKVIQKSSLVKPKHKKKLLQEIKIHRSLKHEHIVKFQKVFEDKKNVYIMLELCTNNTLKELVKARGNLTEFEVRYYIYQILQALKNLRDNLIIHRDIKPGNIFLNDQLQVKIGDFGLASRLQHKNDKRKTICGTPNYLAPEFLEGNNEHGFKADVWSLGVLTYTISIGKAPFATSEVKKTYKKIKKGEFIFPNKPNLSEELKNFITVALTKDPDKRPSINKILKHEFLKKTNIPSHMHLSTLLEKPTKDIFKSLLGRSQISLNKSNISQKRNIKTPKKKDLKNSKVSPHRKKYKENEVHVVKFSDYSQKYGIGYLLSNGCSGVYFNDGTKIIFEPKLQYFQYLEKKEPTNSKGKLYKLKSYPEYLQKKVTLLMHFRSYLENLKPQQVNPSQRAKILDSNIYSSQIYLKKWMNTKHAHLFRLSNKMVQTIFEDKSQILLSSETKQVIFINKKQEKFTYDISKAQDSGNQEMNRRLKYTKEILTQLLSSHVKSQLIQLVIFKIIYINFIIVYLQYAKQL